MPTIMRRSIATAFLGAFAFMATAGLPVQAQQSNEQTAPSAQVDEQQLQAFAQASLEVEELNKKWGPRLAEAQGQDEVQKLREEATAEMTEAVQSAGLSVEDYNRIYRAAQQDQTLAAQIQEFRNQAN